MTYTPTPKQLEAQVVCAGAATHILLEGGSRSGKTFWHVRNTVLRALKAPSSRHCLLRFRLAHIKSAVMMDTLPRVMATAFNGVPWHLNKSDFMMQVGGGTLPSEIWLGGLDDKDRTEKILGNEYATILLNEASQISWQSRCMVMTRLAQKAVQKMENRQDSFLKTRMYYDCNPPNKGHWIYKLFHKHIDPETNQPLLNPSDYARFKMNPQDNAQNLSDGYLDTLKSLSPRLRRRFLDGEYADANPNALFTEDSFDKWRVLDGVVPQLIRVVVAVDPSGSGDVDNADNDAIGIVVVGLGIDGNCYVLEDCTVKAGPAVWGRVATTAYDRHSANIIVGEVNFGGAMVQHVIQTSRPRTPYQAVTASRGKAVRADPVAALYDTGKVRHVGEFRELEDELCGMSTNGYMGEGSPNRADALVWGVTALFPGVVQKSITEVPFIPPQGRVNHWRRAHA